LLANGRLADLAYEHGWINARFGLDELKRRSDITERARAGGMAAGFSEAIRVDLPPRYSGESQVRESGDF
jgi:hypothetical protein